MPTLFLLFSHYLTEEQIAGAKASLGVTDFIALPEELQARWSNVPPEPDSLDDDVRPLLDWLEQSAGAGDYVLAQGDFGAVYAAVRFALEHDLIPIYATTRRNMTETRLEDGSVRKQSQFRHVRYRRYE